MTTSRKLLQDAVECMDAFAQAVAPSKTPKYEQYVALKTKIHAHLAKKEKKKDIINDVALVLAKKLLEAMSRASGRKMLSTPASSVIPIVRMLRAGVTDGEISKTIDWLEKENPAKEYPFVVLSGKALLEKWDKIQLAMGKKKDAVTKNWGW